MALARSWEFVAALYFALTLFFTVIFRATHYLLHRRFLAGCLLSLFTIISAAFAAVLDLREFEEHLRWQFVTLGIAEAIRAALLVSVCFLLSADVYSVWKSRPAQEL